MGKWDEERQKGETVLRRFSQSKRVKSLFLSFLFFFGVGGGGVEKEGEERLASLKSPNPLTSVAGTKMEDHTAF